LTKFEGFPEMTDEQLKIIIGSFAEISGIYTDMKEVSITLSIIYIPKIMLITIRKNNIFYI
jgi:hypothetical protein